MDTRAEKGTKAVGTVNSAWARNEAMNFREEWQLWNSNGWATLGFGAELWPWKHFLMYEKNGVQVFENRFGVGMHTSYFALCWYAGLLPIRFRLWIKAVKMVGRLVQGNVLMKNAWETQLEIRARLGQHPTNHKINTVWIYGLIYLFQT